VTFESFTVVVVPFPFTDRPVAKRRPALVVSASEFNDAHGQVILAMITTARRSDWPSDVPLRDWRKAGLTTQCRVRLKLFTLDQPIVERQLGALSKRDRDAVRASLARTLASA
jgi:mRNA interferase MazF